MKNTIFAAVKKLKKMILLSDPTLDAGLRTIADKVSNNERITFEEGVLLYEKEA